MRGLTAEQALAAVEKVFAAWVAALPKAQRRICPWEKWVGVDAESGRVEFVVQWDRGFKLLIGVPPLQHALDRADAAPLDLRIDRPRAFSAAYQRFVSLAGYLQLHRGDGPILLPLDAVAELLGVSRTAVSGYVRLAIGDRYLRRTKAACRADGGANAAAEYRFDLNLYPDLGK
jgi:hypothetical protein